MTTAVPVLASSTIAGSRAAAFAAAMAVIAATVVRAVVGVRRRAARHRVGAPPLEQGGADPAGGHVAGLVPGLPAPVARRLRRAGIGSRTAVLVWQWGLAAAAVVVAVAAVVGGPGAAALAVLMGALGLALVAVAVGDRATVLVDRELPGVLATIAAGVRSGASLTVAVGEGAVRARGPAAEDLTVVVDSLAAGKGLIEVLETWVRDRPTPGVRMAGAALALAAETGGAGARTVDGVAATLRDRLALDLELAALSSQARASAVVIGVAPIGFVVLTALSDPGVWDFFLRTPAGLACLAAGCVLDAVGAGWMVLVARGAR